MTVAAATGAPPVALLTVPLTVPGATPRKKWVFGVVCPAVITTFRLVETKPGAEAVRVWLPAVNPARLYALALSVPVLAPPLSVTVAPATVPPPDEFETGPVTAPGVGVSVRVKLA